MDILARRNAAYTVEPTDVGDPAVLIMFIVGKLHDIEDYDHRLIGHQCATSAQENTISCYFYNYYCFLKKTD